MTAVPPPDDFPGNLVVGLLALAGSLLALGGILLLVGSGAFGLPNPASAELGPASVFLGLVAGGAALALGGRSTPARVDAYAPRLYPYASAPVRTGLAVLGVVSAAAVVSALLAEYSGALAGGDSAAAPDPAVLNDLYLLASALLWAFALWIILLIARVVRIGRALEQAKGRNVYGQVEAEPHDSVDREPRDPPPAAPRDQRGTVIGLTILVALGAMAAIQAAENGGDPPAPALWAAAELATPVWAAGVGLAFLGLDRYVRELEERYAHRPVPGVPAPRNPSPVDAPSRFVP